MTVKSTPLDPPTRSLDRTDRRILRILQSDGRISNLELARRVHMSPTACLERVRRLEREAYILGYRAQLNPARLDAALLLFVQVTLDRTTSDVFERFHEAIVDIPEVMECHMVAGGYDYLLKVRIRDMISYRAVLGERLTALPGVLQTHTYVVMEAVKEGIALDVGD